MTKRTKPLTKKEQICPLLNATCLGKKCAWFVHSRCAIIHFKLSATKAVASLKKQEPKSPKQPQTKAARLRKHAAEARASILNPKKRRKDE